MKRYAVAYAPEALADLEEIYDRIADAAGEKIAFGYITRIRTFCAGFDTFPVRGTDRKDIRPGLRTVGFERRITVAFAVHETHVEFLRFFGRGRDWERVITDDAG